MPADPLQTDRLRELHEDYAWKVNAAIAEGREDLIDTLCEEYAEEAIRLITGVPPGDPNPPPPAPRRGWRALLGSPRARHR
jgi:hypothetical protein